MDSYLLELDESQTPQRDVDTSYIGGLPCLPLNQELPICRLCGAEQTFFFQVAFPPSHPWADLSLAVFACSSCEQEGHLIPKLPTAPLKGLDIPRGFFENYEENFRLLVFETTSGQLRRDYTEKVKFNRWILRRVKGFVRYGNKVGGKPDWIMGNEAPATYDSTIPMVFLLQIERNYTFEIIQGAPPQMVIDYYGPRGANRPSMDNFYKLFIGDAIYLFGTAKSATRHVYALVQTE